MNRDILILVHSYRTKLEKSYSRWDTFRYWLRGHKKILRYYGSSFQKRFTRTLIQTFIVCRKLLPLYHFLMSLLRKNL